MLNVFQQFGGDISDKDMKRYQKSKHWYKGRFRNLEYTSIDVNIYTMPKLLYKQFTHSEGRRPEAPLPIADFDFGAFIGDDGRFRFIWYGHSVMFFRMNGKNILIDPMFGDNAAPISPVATARFSENSIDLIRDFPVIDAIVITHDHYDHLDMDSILKLKGKTKEYHVALGVGRHLVRWGISPKLITEYDWYDEGKIDDIKLIFTPTRHMAGRGLTDRAMSLWGGWILDGGKEKVYVSGDGGYGKHFKKIGEEYGPFDLAFMECGQYNNYWKQIHMFPEESVQAAIDTGAKKAIPIHWAGFILSHHNWKEPVERFTKASKEKGLTCAMPRIGKVYTIDEAVCYNWWKEYE